MPKITLKAARVNAGLTQKGAAELLGVHFLTVAKYEKDSSKIPFSLAEKASEVYKMPIECLYLGK